MRKARAYILLTKPHVTLSVYYTWIIAYLVALSGPFNLLKMALESLVIILGISWGNAMNNLLDYDIDEVMRRTRSKRVLARGELSYEEAKRFCKILGAVSIATTLIVAILLRDYLTPLLYALAMITYVYLYTALLKRRSWASILVAAFAYVAVILHAWYVATGWITLPGLAIAFMGYFWVLTHLWAVAMHWAEDYALAGVPTITVKFWRKPWVPYVATFTALLATCLLALTPPLLGLVSPLYTLAVLIVFASEIYLMVRIGLKDWRGSKKLTFLCYKLTYPLLAVIFTALLIFHVLA
ncbi:MAG: UbiA family prenyltransferase [Crenarchaeota archaeon]|nr:UbiA family prenyltransferase [Thermoproteota archaeon]